METERGEGTGPSWPRQEVVEPRPKPVSAPKACALDHWASLKWPIWTARAVSGRPSSHARASSHFPFAPSLRRKEPPPSFTHWNPIFDSHTCVSGLTKCGLFDPVSTLKTIMLSVNNVCYSLCPETWVWRTDNSDKSNELLPLPSCRLRGGSSHTTRRNTAPLRALSFSVCLSFPTCQTGRPHWFAQDRWQS